MGPREQLEYDAAQPDVSNVGQPPKKGPLRMQHLQGSSAASSHDDAAQLVVKKRCYADRSETDVLRFRLGNFNAGIMQKNARW